MEKEVQVTEEKKKSILKARAEILLRKEEPRETGEDSLEVLEFLLAHERYAVETRYVREVFSMRELTLIPCTPAFVLGVTNIRGRLLPVVDLRYLLDLPATGITNLNKVIITSHEGMELGILSDTIIGTHGIFRGDLRPAPATLTGINARYIKGIAEEGLIVLETHAVLSDKRLIINEEVEV